MSIKINRDEITHTKPIGSGSFGSVSRALWNNKSVAIKKLDRSVMKDPNYVVMVEEEIKDLATCDCTRVVRVFGYILDRFRQQSIYLVTEFVDQSLETLIHKEKRRFSVTESYRLGIEIAEALDYLHQRKIIHGNLNNRNILIDPDLHVKISDAGLTKTKKAAEGVHPPSAEPWLAPEQLKDLTPSSASDMFNYGRVMWEIGTGKISTSSTDLTLDDWRSFFERYPDDFVFLIKDCLCKSPDFRPTAEDAYYDLVDPVAAPGQKDPKKCYFDFMAKNISQIDSLERLGIISFLATYGAPLGAAEWIFRKKPSIIIQNQIMGEPPLHTAARAGRRDYVEWMINVSPIPHERSIDAVGRTALHYAANIDVAQFLIGKDRGLLYVKDTNGQIPLHIMAQCDQLPIIKWMVYEDVSLLSKQDDNGNTPLHLAIKWNIPPVMLFLAQEDPSVLNTANKAKETPLSLAPSLAPSLLDAFQKLLTPPKPPLSLSPPLSSAFSQSIAKIFVETFVLGAVDMVRYYRDKKV